MNKNANKIINLIKIIDTLSEKDKNLIAKIFKIQLAEGSLIYPTDPEVIKSYGPRDQVECQKIIKISNRITY